MDGNQGVVHVYLLESRVVVYHAAHAHHCCVTLFQGMQFASFSELPSQLHATEMANLV
jgi:hypothetical protein